MIAVPETLPDDPAALKQLLLDVLQASQSDLDKTTQLQEQVALLQHKLFSPKSERSPEDADSLQLAVLNEAEELIEEPAAAPSEAEEAVASGKRRGMRKPLPANLHRVEIVHRSIQISFPSDG
ncbi:transposase [Stutzerimonas kunmingensis]|jgi:hypothetical protein|uniref:transposase n=1 Tax=Stutzerimonas kunmingensis TaxID=1211807 RepID=UPI0035CED955